MIQSSVPPAILYGCENRVLPQDRLQTLRSRIADASLGHQHNISPAIALVVMPQALLDPECVMYQKIVRSVRRFLILSDTTRRKHFYAIASPFQGTLSGTKGPATTFSVVLEKLGWSIDNQGNIGMTTFLSFKLTEISWKRVQRFLTLTWQDRLILRLTDTQKASIGGHFPIRHCSCFENLLRRAAISTPEGYCACCSDSSTKITLTRRW